VITFWFSGDVDSVVPVTATRYSLARLSLSTKLPWYPWYVKKQVCVKKTRILFGYLWFDKEIDLNRNCGFRLEDGRKCMKD